MVPALMTYAEIAAQLVDQFAPYCERIAIAGSIRRGKPDPHDIELVCVPKLAMREIPGQVMLGGSPPTETFSVLDFELGKMKAHGELKDRKGSDGKGAWGPRFKRALYVHEGRQVPLDLFSVISPAQWGVIFAIRTGPADFSHLLVTSRLQGGAMPSTMAVSGGQLRHGGVVVQTPEESDFFAAMGLPCWEPEDRDVYRLRAWLAKQKAEARA